jgi:hypothetical protein
MLENIHLSNTNPKTLDLTPFPDINALEAFKQMIGSMKYSKVGIEEIKINTEEEFSQYEHQFLSGYYIAIDLTDSYLRIVTESRKAFLIDIHSVPLDVYSLVFKVQLPRKICLNSKEIFKKDIYPFNGLYDIGHVATMFCGCRESDLKRFVEIFKPNADNDINNLLYNLYEIKNSLNLIIEKNGFFPLVNKEFKILEIVSLCEKNGLPFSKDNYLSFIEDIKTRYERNTEMFKEVYGESYVNKESIFKGLKNKGCKLIFNENYLQQVEDCALLGLAAAHRLYNSNINKKLVFTDDRLFLKYEPYSDYGHIECNFTFDKFHFTFLKTDSDKYYVTGSYEDLFLRAFANFSGIDYLKQWAYEKTIIPSLAYRVFGDKYLDDKPLYEFYAISFLKGFIQGYFNPEDMMYYLFEELDFFLNKKEVEEISNLFFENCKEILDYIYNFDREISSDKRFSFADNMPIYKFIKLTEADIFKDALCLVYDNIENYNRRNKYKIGIIGLTENTIIVESDKGAFNIALDIINRNLTTAYNKYIRYVPALCAVYTGYKIIRG